MDNIVVEPLNPSIKERPLWSVMIPTFNCTKYLKKTLQSVLIQDIGPDLMEIWVVDDHSTEDDPQAIVQELGRGRVKFYRQNLNVGQLNNFQTCLNLSTGKIIHLLHGDDFVHPGFYNKLEKPFLSENNIGAAFTRHQFVDENNNTISISENISCTKGIIKNFIFSIASKQIIQTPSIVVKRNVYEEIGGFNKNLKWCEDWEMWIRIACNYDFYYEPSILASYRVHKNSNTGSTIKSGKFIGDALNCINIYASYLPYCHQIRKKLVRDAKAHFLTYAIDRSNDFKNIGDKKSAILILIKAFKLSYDFKSRIAIIKLILKIKLQNTRPFLGLN